MTIGEWYHCYTRGVDKRVVFESSGDYDRFLVHLYVANGMKSPRVSDLNKTGLSAVLADDSLDRGEPLVNIGAYSLMPTHAHFLLQEIRDGGISAFMQKVFTGYTMYFNNKNVRTGALFSGTFKSKHIDDDIYLKQVVPYVLLNHAELFEPNWKKGVGKGSKLKERLLEYPYSSLQDFFEIGRPQNKIVSGSLLNYYERRPAISDMIRDAQEYYLEQIPQV